MKILRQKTRFVRTATIWSAGTFLAAALSGAAAAHSFSVAILAADAASAEQLPSAVRGFLVASAERDAHPDETADGHIGGLDVFLIPLPTEAAEGIGGLIGTAPDSFDIVVVTGDDLSGVDGVPGVIATTIIMTPGALPDDAQRSGFTERYLARFAVQPDRAAAQGYNAARRIDLALRPFGGLSETDAIREALRETADGIDW